MGQIQGALVGIAMVLSAVFIPMAFFGQLVRSTVSSPSPSFPRWRCRYWWR
jgi:multidrug efflux pump subunit AcrB